MANPQPIPFTQFSAELLRAIVAYPFTARQYKVMLAVAIANYEPREKTKHCEMTIADLAEVTGLDESHARKAVRELVDGKALKRVDLGKKRFELGIEKDYDKWTCGPNQPVSSGPNRPESKDKFRAKSARSSGPNQPAIAGQISPEVSGDSLLGSSKLQIRQTNNSIDPRNGSAREFVDRRDKVAAALIEKHGQAKFDAAMAACGDTVMHPIAWVKKRLEAKESNEAKSPRERAAEKRKLDGEKRAERIRANRERKRQRTGGTPDA